LKPGTRTLQAPGLPVSFLIFLRKFYYFAVFSDKEKKSPGGHMIIEKQPRLGYNDRQWQALPPAIKTDAKG